MACAATVSAVCGVVVYGGVVYGGGRNLRVPLEKIYNIQTCASIKIVLTLWLLIIATDMRTKNVLVKTRTKIEPKLTTVVGSDQAKKRFSVLIQILKVEAIDWNRIGSDLNDTSTETGFFTVSPLIPKKAY